MNARGDFLGSPHGTNTTGVVCKKGKRNVQRVPQSQAAALSQTPKLNKRKSNKPTKSTKISSLFPKRGNRNAKMIEKHKNKITLGKT